MDLIVSLAGENVAKKVKLICSVKDEVECLQTELKMMNALINDKDEEGADERTCTIITVMRKIAYDAEKFIESFNAEPSSSAEFFSASYAGFKRLKVTNQIVTQIEAIKERIAKALEMWKKYDVGQSRVSAATSDRWRTQLDCEGVFVGLEEDIHKLVCLLTSDDANIQLVSIVGMGGSGKTTLARKVCNHEKVKRYFDCLAWVSVNQKWDAEQILLKLLRIAGGRAMDRDGAWTLKELAEKLRQYMERKRCLIIFDDVWEMKFLEQLLPALHLVNTNGKKIIITTRKRQVVDFPDLMCCIHEPRRLSDEESFYLFRRTALIHRQNSNNYADMRVLEVQAKKMLKMCHGLPGKVIAEARILAQNEIYEKAMLFNSRPHCESSSSPNQHNSTDEQLVQGLRMLDKMADEGHLVHASAMWCFAAEKITDDKARVLFLNMRDDATRLAWIQYAFDRKG